MFPFPLSLCLLLVVSSCVSVCVCVYVAETYVVWSRATMTVTDIFACGLRLRLDTLILNFYFGKDLPSGANPISFNLSSYTRVSRERFSLLDTCTSCSHT